MIRKTALLSALVALAIPTAAQASAPHVTVSPKCEDGNIFVQPTPPGLLQINLNDRPAVSVDKPGGGKLNPGGDGISGVGYWIVAPEGQHTVRVRIWNKAWGWWFDQTFKVDCGTPAPVVVERIVEVPVEKIVVVNTPGPERVVERVVTKTKRVRANCLRKVKRGKVIFYNCRKETKKKATPRRKLPGKRHDGQQNRGLPTHAG